MAIVKGWEGRYFEDFEVGDVYSILWAEPLQRLMKFGAQTW